MKKIDKIKLIKKLQPYWAEYLDASDRFMERIGRIEERMKRDKTIAIKDIEFFWVEGNIVGIGNTSRTLKLIHDSELQKCYGATKEAIFLDKMEKEQDKRGRP